MTNATTPLGQSFADSIPVLMVSATAPSHTLGKGWGTLHEITNQEAVTRPLTALSATAMRPEDLPDLVGEAFAIFSSRRPRPVHISIPTDIAEMEIDGNWHPIDLPNRPQADPDSIARAAALLLDASGPAICVGGGATAASDAITAIAERLNAAVFPSNAGKGIVPDSHPLSVGGSLSLPKTQEYLGEADVVLAIGTELADTDSYHVIVSP